MITCTLKDKKYAVDFISGRALREMEPAAKMYAKIVALSNAAVKGEEIPQEQQISVTDAMDVMIRWFCLLFGNQFLSLIHISERALREMEPAAKMYAKIVALSNAAVKGEEIPQDEQISVTDAMDVMIRWFCLLFGNQFSPDDVLDGYPVDRLMHDIALALMAVQTQTTEILSQFPTKAAKEPAKTTEAEEIPLF